MTTVGIFGWPQAGKTTLFRVLTQGRGGTTAHEGPLTLTTAVVPLPDPRLEALYRLSGSGRMVPASLTFVDVAGYPQGRPGSLLGPLRNVLGRMDVLVHVVRAFPSPQVPHSLGNVDPARDLALMEQEFILGDLETVERRLERLAEERQKGARPKEVIERERALFQRLREALQQERPLRALDLTAEERAALQGFTLLSRKPLLVVLNLGDEPWEGQLPLPAGAHRVDAALALEWELSQLPPEDAEALRAAYDLPARPARERILDALREVMDAVTFYTMNEKETRAWLLPRGSSVVEAAGRIHTDMARGFIRAEVMPADAFIQAQGDRALVRSRGAWHLEGREYIVQDGDILYIRFQKG